MKQPQTTVILGAGFAGLSTAFHLSQSTNHRILLLERSSELGSHASGRNAGLVMQCLASSNWSDLVIASRPFLQEHSDQVGFEETGSWQLGSKERLEPLSERRVETRWLDPTECIRRQSILNGCTFESALETPSDGIVDTKRLLRFYAQEAQTNHVELRFSTAPSAIRWTTEGSRTTFQIALEEGVLLADNLVNATGAWANDIASMVSVAPLPIAAYKRHLFVHASQDGTVPAPFVWDQDRHFYFRPYESSGTTSGSWMYCICDESPEDILIESVSDSVRSEATRRREKELPRLATAPEIDAWSCFRTRTEDDAPVLGWSMERPGFFWVAGLGGYGMGASWEVGRIAADQLAAGWSERGVLLPFSPQRFQ